MHSDIDVSLLLFSHHNQGVFICALMVVMMVVVGGVGKVVEDELK